MERRSPPCAGPQDEAVADLSLKLAPAGGGGEGSTGAGKRRYACLFCDKTFLKSQALGGHQNAHKKERSAWKNPYVHDDLAAAAAALFPVAVPIAALSAHGGSTVRAAETAGGGYDDGEPSFRAKIIQRRRAALSAAQDQMSVAADGGPPSLDGSIDMLNLARASRATLTDGVDATAPSSAAGEELDLALRL